MGPALLLLPILVAAIAVYAIGPRRSYEWNGFEVIDEGDAPAVDRESPSTIPGAEGTLELGEGSVVRARLSIFVPAPERREFQSAAMRERYGLPEGELWRLECAWDGEGSAPIPLRGLSVIDAEGIALRPLDEEVKGGSNDPLLLLLTRSDARLRAGDSIQVAMWGRAVGTDARVRLDDGAREIPLVTTDLDLDDLPLSFLSLTATGLDAGSVAGAAADPRDARIAELEAALAAEKSARQTRELAWFEYNRVLANLDIERLVGGFPVDEERLPEGVLDEEETESTAEPEPEPDLALARAGEIHTSLRALLRLEEVHGLDLLECGRPLGRGIGPVVFRTLDDRGRLTGSLFAEVLRLEASRSARTLSIVLEGGYESHGGERTPFLDGARRIVFPFVDPEPWLERLPELFDAADLVPDFDDGRWSVEAVRVELNRLLGLDLTAGLYQVRGIGGVLGRRLVDVQIDHRDRDGRLLEKLFADRLSISLGDSGVVLTLDGGAIVRGARKSAFRDGEHRVFLPRAPLDVWRSATLPGVSEPPRPAREGADEG